MTQSIKQKDKNMFPPAMNDGEYHQVFLTAASMTIQGVKMLDKHPTHYYRMYATQGDDTFRLFLYKDGLPANDFVPQNGPYVSMRLTDLPDNAAVIFAYGDLAEGKTNPDTYKALGYKAEEGLIAFENIYNYLANGILPMATEPDKEAP